MAVPFFDLSLHQVAHHLIHQALPPVGGIHRETAEGVAEAAARGDQRAVVVKDAAAVIQIPVPADALRTEQLIHPRLTAAVIRGDLSHRRHILAPF